MNGMVTSGGLVTWPLRYTTAVDRTAALMRLALSWTRRAICGLRGHDMVLHFEPERLSLHCMSCGVRTQGWTIDVNPVYRRPRRRVGTHVVDTWLNAA
jgi:hypothetical protein